MGVSRFFLRFRFGDRKEILRDRMEEFERPFSIDVISGHYILRDRWKNLRDRFGPSKHLKKALHICTIVPQRVIPFATQLFSTPGTSSNLHNQAPLFTEIRLLHHGTKASVST